MPASVRRSDGTSASALNTSSKPSARHRYGEVGEVELRERDAEALAHQAVHDALVEAVGVGEETLELGAKVVVVEPADRAVELLVVRVAELEREVVAAPPERVEQRVEVLRGGGEARRLDARAARPVRLVALHHARLAQADGLAVDGDGGLALGVGDLVAEVLGLLAHEAVDGEGEQVGEAQLLVVDGGRVQLLEAVDGLAREQLRVAVVDRGGVAARLAPGEVLVVLEVERADELFGAPAVPLQVEVAHGRTPFAGRRQAGRSTPDSTSGRRGPTPLGTAHGVDDRRAGGRRRSRQRRHRAGAPRAARERPGERVHWLTMPPRPGDTVELDVTTLAYGGQGVARLDEFVVFVRGAVPGDRVLARVTKRRQSHAEARALEILSPSPRRVAPRCRHSQECGGCEWQTLAYEAQLEFKQQQVVDSLQRLAHLDGLRAGADPRHGRPVALPQQDGVLVRRRREPAGSSWACTSAAPGGRSSTSSTASWPPSA